MPHAEESITINRPTNIVFDFLLDGTNNPHWRPAVFDIQRIPSKPSGVGAVFKQGLKGQEVDVLMAIMRSWNVSQTS